MQLTYDRLIDFIQITDYEEYATITFTQAAIDLLKESDVAQCNQLADEIINRITSGNEQMKFINEANYILDMVDQAECQILCEMFLSSLFPNLTVDGHTIISGKNDLTIESRLKHCKKKVCNNCFKAIEEKVLLYSS